MVCRRKVPLRGFIPTSDLPFTSSAAHTLTYERTEMAFPFNFTIHRHSQEKTSEAYRGSVVPWGEGEGEGEGATVGNQTATSSSVYQRDLAETSSFEAGTRHTHKGEMIICVFSLSSRCCVV